MVDQINDKRCCGSGVCIINAQGYCWCGQKWDGDKLLPPQPKKTEPEDPNELVK